MKRAMAIVLLVIGAVVLLTSCQKNKDEDAILNVIAADTVWFNANTKVDSNGTATSTFSADTAIIWWRGAQTHPAPTISVAVVGDSAYVEWSRGNVGKVFILINPGDSLQLWQKSLVETAKLNGIFRRTGAVTDTNRGWKLEKISWAWGQSDSVHTVSIDSVKIQSPTSYPNGFVVKDPLHTFYDLDSLVTFKTSEAVTVTLYTNVPDGNAFVHSFILFWPFYTRAPFTNQGNGVYQGTWLTQVIPFPRYAIFDLMSHSTLYTENASYDFNGWLIPYMLK
jgi:hypothetical protein